MTIAEWTFRGGDGTPLDAVEPVWAQALLAEVDLASSLGGPYRTSVVREDSFYKNVIVGLLGEVQMQVASVDDPSDTYTDDLAPIHGGFVSSHFAALYGSEEILDADPDPEFTPAQRQELLSVLGLNVVHNPGQQSTMKIGPAENPTDSHTRKLTIKTDFTITLNDADGVYNVGNHITGSVAAGSGTRWTFTVVLKDDKGNIMQSVTGSNPTDFDFAVGQDGYYTLSVTGTDAKARMLITMATSGGQADLATAEALFMPKNSVLLRVLPAGKSMSTWQAQAWQALQVNGGVPSDPINRNRQITKLYAHMYNDTPLNLIGPDSKTVFKWSGMAALASQLIGYGLAKAQAAQDNMGVLLVVAPDPAEGIRLLAKGNLDVFMDMYPQMLAYKSEGIDALRQMVDNREIGVTQFRAWEEIDFARRLGTADQVWHGNQVLLKYEQENTLQLGAYAENLAYWRQITNTWNPGIPSLTSPIPGDTDTFQTFRRKDDAADIPDDASIGDFDARWAWIIRRQLPAYRPWSDANPAIDIPKLLRGGYK